MQKIKAISRKTQTRPGNGRGGSKMSAPTKSGHRNPSQIRVVQQPRLKAEITATVK
jgi:hypothetical protein